MKPLVVIPSNREVDPSLIDAIGDTDVAVVEAPGFDADGADERLIVLPYEEQKEDFGDDFDLIGHGSAACRNYGVWWGYWQGYDPIINLDDDCWPEPGLVDRYKTILFDGEDAGCVAGGGRWVSTMHGDSGGYYPRGYPYESRLLAHTQRVTETRHVRPVVQVGLWDGTLDLNAVDKVASVKAPPAALDRSLYATTSVLPLCAMNFGCRAEWAPYVYQIPWTRFAGDTLPLHRYDDIIGGIVTCALAQIRGGMVGFGPPFVDHRKKDLDLLAHAAAENLGNVTIGRLAETLDYAADEVPAQAIYAGGGTSKDVALELFGCLDDWARADELGTLLRYATKMYRRWLGHF